MAPFWLAGGILMAHAGVQTYKQGDALVLQVTLTLGWAGGIMAVAEKYIHMFANVSLPIRCVG